MPLVTLLTDFGTKDGFVGAIKGVIWSICPNVQIADITYEIAPQNILEGGLALARSAPFFPDGTIHLAVVDSGVGTQRKAMAARLGTHFYVLPDNGLITPLLQDAQAKNLPVQFIALDNPIYWRQEVSRTFHGRDIFAPAAAHLAAGIPLEQLGSRLEAPVRLELPLPERTPRGWQAQVVKADAFGNLATNLSTDQLDEAAQIQVRIAGHTLDGLAGTYGERHPGELVALIDSEGYLEVAVVNGNAARSLGVQVGEPVEIIFL